MLYHAKLCTDTFETHGNAVQKSATQSNIISWRYEYLLPKPAATAAAHQLETQKTVRPARVFFQKRAIIGLVCVLGGHREISCLYILLMHFLVWHVAMLHVDEQEGGCGQNIHWGTQFFLVRH